MDAWVNIEQLRTLPPLDAVKIPADKFDALMEKFGVEKEDRDYPPHLQRFAKELDDLEE
ncbi:hypothetical protein MKW92_049246, partial [Papaver armeniacum]